MRLTRVGDGSRKERADTSHTASGREIGEEGGWWREKAEERAPQSTSNISIITDWGRRSDATEERKLSHERVLGCLQVVDSHLTLCKIVSTHRRKAHAGQKRGMATLYQRLSRIAQTHHNDVKTVTARVFTK